MLISETLPPAKSIPNAVSPLENSNASKGEQVPSSLSLTLVTTPDTRGFYTLFGRHKTTPPPPLPATRLLHISVDIVKAYKRVPLMCCTPTNGCRANGCLFDPR